MVLRAGYLLLAQQLQEAQQLREASDTGHSSIRQHLSDAVTSAHQGSGTYAYYLDHTGDGETGHVMYSANGETRKAPYEIGTFRGKTSVSIDTKKSKKTIPVVSYNDVAEAAADKGGDPPAGPAAPVKPIESAAAVTDESLALRESAVTLEPIILQEAKADYEIKLIAPGKGSSAYYPAEVLKRDGPNVFKSGTQVYLNHATAAEESARPEGDVRNLAGVLTTPAVYHEAHSKGPGLYARMKVFADHSQMVEEKAPHVGMSIRAAGLAEAGKKQDGLPVLKQLTAAKSVDVVTTAGAGGMILSESARPADGGTGVTEDEAKKLIEAAVSPFRLKAMKADAREAATKLLGSVTLPDAAKIRIIERCLDHIPEKDGAIDSEKLREVIVAEAKAEGEYLAAITGAGKVRGMGASSPFRTELSEAERKAAEDRQTAAEAHEVKIFQRLGLSESGARAAVKGRAA